MNQLKFAGHFNEKTKDDLIDAFNKPIIKEKKKSDKNFSCQYQYPSSMFSPMVLLTDQENPCLTPKKRIFENYSRSDHSKKIKVKCVKSTSQVNNGLIPSSTFTLQKLQELLSKRAVDQDLTGSSSSSCCSSEQARPENAQDSEFEAAEDPQDCGEMICLDACEGDPVGDASLETDEEGLNTEILDAQLKRLRRSTYKRSQCWQFFEVKKCKHTKMLYDCCTIQIGGVQCGAKFAHHGATTRLNTHLRQRHNIITNAVKKQPSRPPVSSKICSKASILEQDYDVATSNMFLISLVLSMPSSLHVIENKWFRLFVSRLNSRYKLPDLEQIQCLLATLDRTNTEEEHDCADSNKNDFFNNNSQS